MRTRHFGKPIIKRRQTMEAIDVIPVAGAEFDLKDWLDDMDRAKALYGPLSRTP